MRHAWTVNAVPVEERSDEGKNIGGLAVSLTDGEDHVEVARIAFVRRNSTNPDTAFTDQLDAEFGKAQEACDLVNDHLDELERTQAQALDDVRGKVREIVGRRRKPV